MNGVGGTLMLVAVAIRRRIQLPARRDWSLARRWKTAERAWLLVELCGFLFKVPSIRIIAHSTSSISTPIIRILLLDSRIALRVVSQVVAARCSSLCSLITPAEQLKVSTIRHNMTCILVRRRHTEQLLVLVQLLFEQWTGFQECVGVWSSIDAQ